MAEKESALVLNMNGANRRQRLAVLIVLAIVVLMVVAVATLILRRKHPLITLYSSQPLAQNIQFPDYNKDASHIRFFTGTAFADLDLTTLKTTSITKEFSLPAVSEIKWQGNYVLVKTATPNESDDLYAFTGEGKEEIRWWLFDLVNQKFMPIRTNLSGAEILSVTWQFGTSDDYYVLAQKNASDQVIETHKINGSTPASLATKSATSLLSTANGLLVQQTSSWYLLNGKQLEKLALESSKQIQLVDAGNQVVYEQLNSATKTATNKSTVSPGDLYQFDLRNKKPKLLSRANSGNYAVTNTGLFMLPNQSETDQTKNKKESLLNFFNQNVLRSPKIDEQDVLNIGNLRTVQILPGDKTHLFITNTNNELVEVSEDSAVQKRSSAYGLLFLLSSPLQLKDATLDYDGVSNSLEIYLLSLSDVSVQRSNVMKELIAQNKDPNQVKKQWIHAGPTPD